MTIFLDLIFGLFSQVLFTLVNAFLSSILNLA